MRRIGRYILNGLTVLSLTLCVATTGLWVRSYRIVDEWYWWPSFDHQARSVISSAGRLTFDTDAPPDLRFLDLTRQVSHDTWIRRERLNEETGFWRRLGFRYDSSRRYFGPVVGAPHWVFGLLLGLPAIALNNRRLRSKRRSVGHCRNCNYDLGATPDRCPECGVIPTKVEA